MASKHVHYHGTTISVLYSVTPLFYSDFTHADTFQYYTWRHESSRGKLHLNLPTWLLAWRLITHYFMRFLVIERVLFVSSFYWHVTWKGDTGTVQKNDNVLTFGHSNLVTYEQLDTTVLNNNIESLEQVFSLVHASSRTSSSTARYSCIPCQCHSTY